MAAGGAEATIGRIGIAGCSRGARLVDRVQRPPDRGFTPWDKDRDGFVMGEGAGVVVLEETSTRRNAAP